jgi:hypothetical protein
MARRMGHSEAMQLSYKKGSAVEEDSGGAPLLLHGLTLGSPDSHHNDDSSSDDDVCEGDTVAGDHWRCRTLENVILKLDECAADAAEQNVEMERASAHQLRQAWDAFRGGC